MESVADFYHYMNYELAEKRTSEWFLIGSYVPLTIITMSYLLFVKIIGPKWMEKRDAFKLNKILPPYNLLHVAINIWGFHKAWYSGFHDGTLKFTCQPFTDDPVLLEEYLNCAWIAVAIKILDLTDTIFFILRKKNKQVSFLHVYHHVSMCWLAFLATKYNFTGSMTGVPALLNCIVHIIMYLYYFLSCFGPNIRKWLDSIKSFITTIQMIQFILMILHASQIFLPWCYNKKLIYYAYVFLPNVIVYFYLFYDFYKKSYNKSKSNAKVSDRNSKLSNGYGKVSEGKSD